MPLKMYEQPSSDEERLANSKVTFTIAVAAGKGGVGKSTVAVNLALALKRAGYAVGIMDADIYGPSLRRMLPEKDLPRSKGKLISPANCNGIRMISMAYFRNEHEAAAVRAPIANGIISQLLHRVDWGFLDFLFIDFPPGTGDIQLTLAQQANFCGAIMVTTPQEVAVMDVRKAIHLFTQVNIPLIGVVENMSYFFDSVSQKKIELFGSGGGERLARESGTLLMGQIPIDPLISHCGDQGSSVFDEDRLSLASRAFEALGEAVVARVGMLRQQIEGCLTAIDLEWREMP